ncbi:MAG: tetratricopeptide repeat protein [Candidatus Obscuribacterales bacterium]
MGTSTLNRDIAQTSTLEEALRILLWSRFDEIGTMRVISGRTTGFIGIANGYIRGAMVATSGDQGLGALNQLLAVKPAQCEFSTRPEDQLPLAGQGLQIAIETVIVSVPTMGPGKTPVTMGFPAQEPSPPLGPPPQQAPWPPPGQPPQGPSALQVPRTPEKKQWEVPKHQSLTADQLRLLETYRKLNGPMDRAAFLKENDVFVKFLDEDTLSDNQKQELNTASRGYSEKAVLDFLEFHRKMLGDAATVTDAQVEQLRTLYRDLQTEERRNQFLAESGKLDENIALERGEGIWQKEQEERTKALNALKGPEKVYTDSHKLIAQDGDYIDRTSLASKMLIGARILGWNRRRKGEVDDDFTSQGPQLFFLRPEVMGMIVSISLVGTIAYLVYSHVVQSAYVGIGNPDEDMVTMDLVIDEALGNEVPRAIKDAQIQALVEGGADQAGGGSLASEGHADPAVIKRQTEAAKRMMAQGRLNEAKALLSSIVSQDPYDVNVRSILVDSYLKLGKRREARAVAIDGLTYARYRDDRAAMEKLFQKCVGD